LDTKYKKQGYNIFTFYLFLPGSLSAIQVVQLSFDSGFVFLGFVFSFVNEGSSGGLSGTSPGLSTGTSVKCHFPQLSFHHLFWVLVF